MQTSVDLPKADTQEKHKATAPFPVHPPQNRSPSSSRTNVTPNACNRQAEHRSSRISRRITRIPHGFGCPVLSAVGGQIGPGVARLGVGQGLLVPARVARSWEAEDRPLPGRGPLDDLEPV